jgi:hypothetical protein
MALSMDPWHWGGFLANDAKNNPSAGQFIAGLGQGLPMLNHRGGTLDPIYESPRTSNLPAGQYELRIWAGASGNSLKNNMELRIGANHFAALTDGVDNCFSRVQLDGASALTVNAVQADSGCYQALVQAAPSN